MPFSYRVCPPGHTWPRDLEEQHCIMPHCGRSLRLKSSKNGDYCDAFGHAILIENDDAPSVAPIAGEDKCRRCGSTFTLGGEA